MRLLLALLLGLLLALPAAAAPPDGGFCGRMLMPAVQLRVLSRGFSAHHSGVDLMAPYGSPIRAAAGGTVIYAGWYYAYGNIVDIQHADGVITRYAHMSAFAPGIAHGTPVAAGEVIGQIGTSGNAHGAHVHFEVRIDGHPVDPKPYLGLAVCDHAATGPAGGGAHPQSARRTGGPGHPRPGRREVGHWHPGQPRRGPPGPLNVP